MNGVHVKHLPDLGRTTIAFGTASYDISHDLWCLTLARYGRLMDGANHKVSSFDILTFLKRNGYPDDPLPLTPLLVRYFGGATTQ